MILTHFILCVAQPPQLVTPDPAVLPLAAAPAMVALLGLGGAGWPVLRVPAPVTRLTVQKA